MLLAAAFVFWVPLLLSSEDVRLTVVVEEMRRLTFAGDQASVR